MVTSRGAGRLVNGEDGALSVVAASLGDVTNYPVLAGSAEDLGVSWVGLDAVVVLVYALDWQLSVGHIPNGVDQAGWWSSSNELRERRDGRKDNGGRTHVDGNLVFIG